MFLYYVILFCLYNILFYSISQTLKPLRPIFVVTIPLSHHSVCFDMAYMTSNIFIIKVVHPCALHSA